MKKTVTIERQKLDALAGILGNLEDTFGTDINIKLAIAANKNLKVIEAELKLIDELAQTKFTDEVKQYEQGRHELLNKYADKNEDGSIKTRTIFNGSTEAVFANNEDHEAFEAEFEVYRQENVDVIEQYGRIMTARQEFINQTTDIDLQLISADILPNIRSEGKRNGYATYVISVLDPMLLED